MLCWSLWRLPPPFIVRLLVGTLCGPRLSHPQHLLYNPGPIAVVWIFLSAEHRPLPLGQGHVGFCLGDGGGGGALALGGAVHCAGWGNGFTTHVGDVVMCLAPQKISQLCQMVNRAH